MHFPPEAKPVQFHSNLLKLARVLEGILHFVEHGYKLCITHGNGPQVGDEFCEWT